MGRDRKEGGGEKEWEKGKRMGERKEGGKREK